MFKRREKNDDAGCFLYLSESERKSCCSLYIASKTMIITIMFSAETAHTQQFWLLQTKWLLPSVLHVPAQVRVVGRSGLSLGSSVIYIFFLVLFLLFPFRFILRTKLCSFSKKKAVVLRELHNKSLVLSTQH